MLLAAATGKTSLRSLELPLPSLYIGVQTSQNTLKDLHHAQGHLQSSHVWPKPWENVLHSEQHL